LRAWEERVRGRE
jgi:hypothetical protein